MASIGKAMIKPNGKRARKASGKGLKYATGDEPCCCSPPCIPCANLKATIFLSNFTTACHPPSGTGSFKFLTAFNGTYGPSDLVYSEPNQNCGESWNLGNGQFYNNLDCTDPDGDPEIQTAHLSVGDAATLGIDGVALGDQVIQVRITEGIRQHVVGQLKLDDLGIDCESEQLQPGVYDLTVWFGDDGAFPGGSASSFQISVLIEEI